MLDCTLILVVGTYTSTMLVVFVYLSFFAFDIEIKETEKKNTELNLSQL